MSSFDLSFGGTKVILMGSGMNYNMYNFLIKRLLI